MASITSNRTVTVDGKDISHCDFCNAECDNVKNRVFYCNKCNQPFCQSHSDVERHDCIFIHQRTLECPLCKVVLIIPDGADPNQIWVEHSNHSCTAADQPSVKKECGSCQCPLNDLNMHKCANCDIEFCLKHRLSEDHVCIPALPVAGPMVTGVPIPNDEKENTPQSKTSNPEVYHMASPRSRKSNTTPASLNPFEERNSTNPFEIDLKSLDQSPATGSQKAKERQSVSSEELKNSIQNYKRDSYSSDSFANDNNDNAKNREEPARNGQQPRQPEVYNMADPIELDDISYGLPSQVQYNTEPLLHNEKRKSGKMGRFMTALANLCNYQQRKREKARMMKEREGRLNQQESQFPDLSDRVKETEAYKNNANSEPYTKDENITPTGQNHNPGWRRKKKGHAQLVED